MKKSLDQSLSFEGPKVSESAFVCPAMRGAAPAAYDALLPLAQALRRDEVEHVNLDVPTTAGTCVYVAQQIAPHRAHFAALVGIDMVAVDGLGPAGLALQVAHANVRMEVHEPERVKALQRRAIEFRQKFVAWGKVLAAEGIIPVAVTRRSKGRGHGLIAMDVIGWVMKFRTCDARVVRENEALSRETLDEAQAVAEALLTESTEHAMHPAKLSVAGDLRERFFTIAVTRYRHVRKAALFLPRDVVDGEALVPSLYRKQARRRARTAERPETADATAMDMRKVSR